MYSAPSREGSWTGRKPILRRAILRCLAAIGPLRAWTQTAGFPGDQGGKLRTVAAVVLPSELGAAGAARVAAAFEQWVRDYRPGAEMDHGYGFTRLRSKGQSPAAGYVEQLRALDLSGDSASQRTAIEAAIARANITSLPQTPDGRHIATDLMSFYFRSSEGNDLCYRAHIGRDECRGLQGSEKEPQRI